MTPSAAPRGFVLHPTYRLHGGRAVVHLYGVLEDGYTFEVRDDRQRPYFYIRSTDAQVANRLRAPLIEPSERRTMVGAPVVRLVMPTPRDVLPLRDRLHREGVETFEADVRFAYRLLIDRGIRSGVAIRGESRPGPKLRGAPGCDWLFTNPELAPASCAPALRVLSVDIETDRSGAILAVSLFGCHAAEVLLLAPTRLRVPLPSFVTPCSSEEELLRTLVERIRTLDPDVLTGWNVIQFDLTMLERRAQQLGVAFPLGRAPGPLRIDPPSSRAGARATIAGRMVLDGPQLLRGAFIRMEDYSLDTVARTVLGEGKTLHGPDRVSQIWESYAHDLPRFVDYALTDARLVVEILERLKLVELQVERSLLTGLPLDRVHASVAAFDFLYLSALGRRGRVAPTVAGRGTAPIVAGGGTVLEPKAGLHHHVLVFDFKSLYPSLIRTFEIDPLGLLSDDATANESSAIVAPNGARFRRAPGILTELLDPLFARREVARQSGDRVASQAIKILMNSFYGVLGTSVCRFASSQLATAITSFGREILLWTKQELERRGLEVLYGDTDSLFVASARPTAEQALALGEALVPELNATLAHYLAVRWGVESRLELELERLYLRLLLLEVRHGKGGARKRYAGLVRASGREEVAFVGLEAVRRDWTDLARQVQRELYERLFRDRPVEEYLRATIADLKLGRLDDLLIYRKGLGKGLDAYTETTPPHVVAARKRSRPPKRRIAYVWTAAGPEPADEQRSSFDYRHYVDKQIRPVAEPVLQVLGLAFDEVLDGVRQLELF